MGSEKPKLDMAFPISLFYYEYFLSYKDIPFNIYNTPNKDDVISCGVAKKDYINYNEFDIITKPGKLIDVKRTDFKADLEFCCFNYFNHRYWTSFDTKLTPLKPGVDQYSYSDGFLYGQTCATDTHFQAFECTDIYKTECIDKLKTAYSVSDYIYIPCYNWIYNLGNRYSNTFNTIHNTLFDLCKNNLSSFLFCDAYIQGLRANGNAELQVLADSMIYSQTNKYDFKCAFPPSYILEEASKYNTPYECWYKPCTTEPSSHLLYKNLVNQQKCRVTNCDIQISNFNLSNDSDINITCNSKSNVDKKKFKEVIDKESNYTLFPFPNHLLFIILILIFIILINFYNPY